MKFNKGINMFIGKLDLEGLKLETAITHCIKDLREINQIENIILNTESPDIVSHYYNMLHNENVVFDTQSALVGKEGLLDKIKHLKERIVKSFEESNINNLQKLREIVKSKYPKRL